MSNFNRIIIMGNLTREPDYKPLQAGGVTRLGIASNRQYKNKQTGNLVQEVCFIDVDVFGPQAESCRQYLQKGRPVLVEGRIKLDTWQAADGQTRSKHSIVAEKVVFLQTSQGTQVTDMETLHDTEPDIKPAQSSKTSKKSPVAQDDDMFKFNDESPFSDELPF